MNNWERLFPIRILGRGADYCLGRSVKALNITDSQITADVDGSEMYHVEIEMNKDKIIAMHCTCPYAAKGYRCKHMAATLYAYEEKINHKENPTVEESNSIDKLEKCKYKINFFAEVYMNDDEECIEYDDVDDYVSDLINFIHDEIKELIDDKEYTIAFKALAYIIQSVNNIDINDLEGKIEALGNEIYDTWLEILKLVDIQEKHALLDWVKNYFCLDYTYYMRETIEMILEERR